MRKSAVALAFAGSACLAACRAPERPASSPTPSAARVPTAAEIQPSATAAPGGGEYQRLVGRWMRSDWDYMIWIRGAAADGALDASYLNPNPIHVAQAQAWKEGGVLRFRVEMQDRNYPGSYYLLAYDPGSDTLSGVYHQLVQNQKFEVAFSRLDSQPEGAGPSR
jgi:hypothetical protein